MHSIKLTPKKVASAIGVSESSMKRWCDRGLIEFQTTAGGHRRLSQSSVIEFLRSGRHALVKPELIGLPSGIRPDERDRDASCNEFLTAVLDGYEDAARQIILELFLSGLTVADLGDQILSPSFKEVGLKWECGSLEVYRERRACEITMRVLSELRTLLPEPDPTAPSAIGGSPGPAGYLLPTMLVEMVFREAGWQAQSLGAQLPFETLSAAAREQTPRLFWLSISHIDDEADFLQAFEQFRSTLPPQLFLAVGGRALQEQLRHKMQYSAFGDNLKQLESLARTLKANPFVNVSENTITNY